MPRSRAYVAYALDLLLLVALLALFSPRLTGLPLHEWLGLAVAAPVVCHLLLSWRWIARVTKSASRSASLRTRINYLLNALLFVLIVVEVVSGAMISAVAVPRLGLTTVNDRAWRALHNESLNWTLLMLGLHLAVNWVPLVIAVRGLTTRVMAHR